MSTMARKGAKAKGRAAFEAAPREEHERVQYQSQSPNASTQQHTSCLLLLIDILYFVRGQVVFAHVSDRSKGTDTGKGKDPGARGSGGPVLCREGAGCDQAGSARSPCPASICLPRRAGCSSVTARK